VLRRHAVFDLRLEAEAGKEIAAAKAVLKLGGLVEEEDQLFPERYSGSDHGDLLVGRKDTMEVAVSNDNNLDKTSGAGIGELVPG
jgi:hypothetical protein